MANLNKVMLIGNLTRDPEMRYTPSGTSVCEIGLAINRFWNDSQSGERREQTCYVDCSAFGRQAETLSRYMRKGRPLFVEGRLDFQTWEAKDGGGKRSKLKVIIENFQFLGGREDGEGGDAPRSGGAPMQQRSQQAPAHQGGYGDAPPAGSYGGGGGAQPALDDDDIPF